MFIKKYYFYNAMSIHSEVKMERKINAEVEFQIKEIEKHKDIAHEKDENTCQFLPLEVVKCFYEYPLKIIFPSSATSGCCQWVYPMNFGGGLVEGDHLCMSFKIGAKCCVLIATLSFPKVYHCENGIDSQQHTKYVVDSEALLCVLPDPTVCFKKASYNQSQTFHLASDSNLVLLDWFTSGRYIKGERWIFSKLRTVSSIFVNGKLEFREAQNIQDTPFVKIENVMKSYNIIGTCMVMGPLLESLYSFILSELGRCRGYGEKPQPDSLFAASPLLIKGSSKCFGCIVRFSAESVPKAMKRVQELLFPLFTVIGGNPFINK